MANIIIVSSLLKAGSKTIKTIRIGYIKIIMSTLLKACSMSAY